MAATACQRLGTGLCSTESSNMALLAFKNDPMAWVRGLSQHRLHSVEPSTGRAAGTASESTLDKLHFDLLLRQVCEDNLLQPNLFVDFPLIFLNTHTQKNMSCKKPLSTRKEKEGEVLNRRFSKLLVLWLQALATHRL